MMLDMADLQPLPPITGKGDPYGHEGHTRSRLRD